MDFLNLLIAGYSSAKTALSVLTGASQDLLHVHVGLLILVLAALLLRRKMRSPIPLALVAILALVNELVDWLAGGPHTTLFEQAIDFVNTVFWPAILFLLARRWR